MKALKPTLAISFSPPCFCVFIYNINNNCTKIKFSVLLFYLFQQPANAQLVTLLPYFKAIKNRSCYCLSYCHDTCVTVSLMQIKIIIQTVACYSERIKRACETAAECMQRRTQTKII